MDNQVFAPMKISKGAYPTYYVPMKAGPQMKDVKMLVSNHHSSTTLLTGENDVNKPGKYKIDKKKLYKYKNVVNYYFREQSDNYYLKEAAKESSIQMSYGGKTWNSKAKYTPLYQINRSSS